MKRKPNYLKHILQWGVLAAIAGTVLWANFSENPSMSRLTVPSAVCRLSEPIW